jgi:hypothetical protein
MEDQDTSGLGSFDADDNRVDRSVQTDAQAEPARPDADTASGVRREDDRNDEVEDSPAPDPEEGSQDAEDVPTAD